MCWCRSSILRGFWIGLLWAWNILFSFNATKFKYWYHVLIHFCYCAYRISILFYSIWVINKMISYLFLCHFILYCWQMIWSQQTQQCWMWVSVCYSGDLLQSYIVSIQAKPSYVHQSLILAKSQCWTALMGLSGNTPPSTQRLRLICDTTFSLQNSCSILRVL